MPIYFRNRSNFVSLEVKTHVSTFVSLEVKTHVSTIEPRGALYRKGLSKVAKLCFVGHGLISCDCRSSLAEVS